MDATTTFEAWPLPNPVRDALSKQGIVTPTQLQEQTIPALLNGQDILGLAQNGTGKTLAFCLPLISLLDQDENRDKVGLILAPSNETATQITESIKRLTAKMTGRWKPVLVIDGPNAGMQEENLRKRPRVIVATPKRLSDHLATGIARLENVKFVVIEEADQLIAAPEHTEHLDTIFENLPPERQTAIFSAANSDGLEALSNKYLNTPAKCEATSGELPALAAVTNNDQEENGKFDALIKEIEQRSGSIIVFCRTKFRARRLAQRLFKAGHPTDSIHSDRSQNQKQNTIKAFLEQQFRVLVATDIAIGSVEIEKVDHIINFDIQDIPEAVLTRAKSNEATLFALDLATPEEWQEVQKLLGEAGSARSAEIQKQKAAARENGERPERSRNNHKKKNKSPSSKRKPKTNSAPPYANGNIAYDDDDDSQVFFQPSVEEQLNQLDSIVKRKNHRHDDEMKRQVQHARTAQRLEGNDDNFGNSYGASAPKRHKRGRSNNGGNRGGNRGNSFR